MTVIRSPVSDMNQYMTQINTNRNSSFQFQYRPCDSGSNRGDKFLSSHCCNFGHGVAPPLILACQLSSPILKLMPNVDISYLYICFIVTINPLIDLLDMINISLMTKMKVINEKIDDNMNGSRTVERWTVGR